MSAPYDGSRHVDRNVARTDYDHTPAQPERIGGLEIIDRKMHMSERLADQAKLSRPSGTGRNKQRFVSIREQVIDHDVGAYSRIRPEMHPQIQQNIPQ